MERNRGEVPDLEGIHRDDWELRNGTGKYSKAPLLKGMAELASPVELRTSSSRASKYRPEIDGLRAFAVFAVIINHFNKDLLPSGYLGVDIFFVISGYVITSSLAGRESKNFLDFLTGFYERRIKRLVPALVVFVLITSVLICLFNPDPGGALGLGWKSVFGLSNISLYRSSTDYFSQSTELNPFTHTWSLGVEEQFYLLFPFLIWFSGFGRQTAKGARQMFLWVGALSIASLIGFIFLYQANQPAAYFLMPTRFWEMAAGCLIFIGFQKRARIEQSLEEVPPLLVVAAMVGLMLLPVSAAVPATVGIVLLSAILIACLKQGTAAYKFFTLEKVVYIGLISYSLYLWHWSVLSISRWTIGIHWWSAPIQLAVMFTCAILSHKWIETPARNYQLVLKQRLLTIACGGALVVLSAVIIKGIQAASGAIYAGDRKIEDSHSFLPFSKSDKILKDINSAKVFSRNCNMTPHHLTGKDYRPKPIVAESFIDRCLFPEDSRRRILLIGDSFASISTPAIAAIASDLGYGFGTVYGFACPYPLPFTSLKHAKSEKCSEVDEKLLYQMLTRRVRSGDVVALRLYLTKSQYLDYSVGTPEISDAYDEVLNTLHHDLAQRGAKLLVIGANPTLDDKDASAITPQWFNRLQVKNNMTFDAYKNEESRQYLEFDKRLENVSIANGWEYVPTRKFLCPRSQCILRLNGKSFYFDNHHLTEFAMSHYFQEVRKRLQSLSKN